MSLPLVSRLHRLTLEGRLHRPQLARRLAGWSLVFVSLAVMVLLLARLDALRTLASPSAWSSTFAAVLGDDSPSRSERRGPEQGLFSGSIELGPGRRARILGSTVDLDDAEALHGAIAALDEKLFHRVQVSIEPETPFAAVVEFLDACAGVDLHPLNMDLIESDSEADGAVEADGPRGVDGFQLGSSVGSVQWRNWLESSDPGLADIHLTMSREGRSRYRLGSDGSLDLEDLRARLASQYPGRSAVPSRLTADGGLTWAEAG